MNCLFLFSKSRAQELSNDVSFVIFGHQTLDLGGGGQIDPSSISWFSSTPAEIGLTQVVQSQNISDWSGESEINLYLIKVCLCPRKGKRGAELGLSEEHHTKL